MASRLVNEFVGEVDLSNGEAIEQFFNDRFKSSPLPDEEKTVLYTNLMMNLCIRGKIFSVQSQKDLEKMRSGVNVEAIQRILLANSDYKSPTC